MTSPSSGPDRGESGVARSEALRRGRFSLRCLDPLDRLPPRGRACPWAHIIPSSAKLGTGFTLLALLTAPPSVGDEGRASVESTVLFNTDCARCHEGECSGRLSFHLPPEAADQHIRRHGGELPAKQVRELYELLR